MHESDNSIYVAVELIRGATMIQLLKEDKKLSHHNIAAFLKSIV